MVFCHIQSDEQIISCEFLRALRICPLSHVREVRCLFDMEATHEDVKLQDLPLKVRCEVQGELLQAHESAKTQ